MTDALMILVLVGVWTWLIADLVGWLLRRRRHQAINRHIDEAIALVDVCPRCGQPHLGLEDCPTYRGTP